MRWWLWWCCHLVLPNLAMGARNETKCLHHSNQFVVDDRVCRVEIKVMIEQTRLKVLTVNLKNERNGTV
ncbi:hypothetical protein RDWZM_006293, partial [Blomia tropicalis]